MDYAPANVEALQLELSSLRQKLGKITQKIRCLLREKDLLQKQHDTVEKEITIAQANSIYIHVRDQSPYDSMDGFPWSSELADCSSRLFHIENFRPLQLRAMNATLDAKDVILVMPTGAGKSIVYQLPALLDQSKFNPPRNCSNNSITLVISPLVSLMTDQTMNLTKLGIGPDVVRMFDSSTSLREQKELLDAIAGIHSLATSLRLLYVTPEKIAKSKLLLNRLESAFAQGRLSRLVVDEIHCVSQWGHDFRPDYQFLHVLRRQFSDVPLLGLTATASSRVILDIQSILGLQRESCLVLRAKYNRENLFYQVQEVTGPLKNSIEALLNLLTTRYQNQSGIIYCFSQKDTEDVARELRHSGILTLPYHACLNASERTRVHRDWCAGEILVIVATVAFGMGIDKPDVRFVIHLSASKSIENYYQESGRAGRDSKPSDCILLWRFGDLFRLASMVSSERTGLVKLYQMVAYCLNTTVCRRRLIAEHLGDPTWCASDCSRACDNCCRAPAADSGSLSAAQTKDVVDLIHSVLLSHAPAGSQRITGPKLVGLMTGSLEMRQFATESLGLSAKSLRIFCEHAVAWCLINNIVKLEFHFTPYSTVCYVVPSKTRYEIDESHCMPRPATIEVKRKRTVEREFELPVRDLTIKQARIAESHSSGGQ